MEMYIKDWGHYNIMLGNISKITVNKVRTQLDKEVYKSLINISRGAKTGYKSTEKVMAHFLAEGIAEFVNTNSGKVYRIVK